MCVGRGGDGGVDISRNSRLALTGQVQVPSAFAKGHLDERIAVVRLLWRWRIRVMQSAEKGRQHSNPKAAKNVTTHAYNNKKKENQKKKKNSANRRACLDYFGSLRQSHLIAGCQMTIWLVSFVTTARVTSAIVRACEAVAAAAL